MLCLKEPTLLVDSNELRSYSIQKKTWLEQVRGSKGERGAKYEFMYCLSCSELVGTFS